MRAGPEADVAEQIAPQLGLAVLLTVGGFAWILTTSSDEWFVTFPFAIGLAAACCMDAWRRASREQRIHRVAPVIVFIVFVCSWVVAAVRARG